MPVTVWNQPYSNEIPTGRSWRVDTIQIPANQLSRPANTMGSGTVWELLNQSSDLPDGYSLPAYIG